MTRLKKGPDAAIEVIDTAFEYARRKDLPALVRCLGGMRTHLLAESGRVGAAERAWRDASLPEDDAQCLQPDGQSWRELEAIACARLRLLVAAGRFDAGRRFAETLVAVAAQRGLRRSQMRGLALSVALERTAGEPEQCEARVVEFLGHYAETGYAAGAVRECAAFLAALKDLPGDRLDRAVRESAGRLLELLRAVGGEHPEAVRFTSRELLVLEHLKSMQDGEIAAMLGITVPGVRYHVGKIFRKLGVNDRLSAVRRARDAGLIANVREA